MQRKKKVIKLVKKAHEEYLEMKKKPVWKADNT